MLIDVERLRADIMDYYGTAAFSGFPAAIVDLARVERMSGEELVRFAEDHHFDLSKYIR